jgi:tetratricopeptide (TPR) repeat protein
MLESVREYGRELLRAAGELEATAQAHLEHYADLAVESRDQLTGREQESTLDRLRRDHDNVRAALAWATQRGQVDAGLRLAGAIWLFWDYAGYRREGLDWLERLLAAGGSTQPAVQAQALHAAGRLAEEVGAYDASIARHQESLGIYRELGNPRGVAAALRGIALAVGNQGDHGRAIQLIDEAVSVLRELDDPAQLASALMNLGVSITLHGDPRGSMPLFEEALALRRGVGDALGTALCLINLAERAGAEGDLERAQACLDEAVVIARRLQSPYHVAAALVSLGELARMRGDVREAATGYREALRLFADIGERSGAGVCVRLLAWVAWTEGRLVPAARLYGAAGALCPTETAPDNTERERALHERASAGLRDRLGEEAFATAREAGAFFSMEEAVAEAARED